MALIQDLPASILGGDPFNQFRFIYRRDCLWKLYDEEYCYSVMRAAYEAGGTAFDLSFDVNARLFHRLKEDTGAALTGLGNPTWEQGIVFAGRHLQYNRDRVLRTLVARCLPRDLASRVENKLSHEDLLVFGYDRQAEPLSDADIASIHLDQPLFRRRLEVLQECQVIMMGGADADWLISLGRIDILREMAAVVRQMGFTPFLMTSYASYTLPIVEAAGLDVDGYTVPLNREWSWFDRDAALDAVHHVGKPVIAFMPLAGGGLHQDIDGALTWLYQEAGVRSILFGTATAEHAADTTQRAAAARARVWSMS